MYIHIYSHINILSSVICCVQLSSLLPRHSVLCNLHLDELGVRHSSELFYYIYYITHNYICVCVFVYAVEQIINKFHKSLAL